MITGQDIPEKPRGPRTLVLPTLLWIPLFYFLYGP
jgi:hypothetical protein